jgi:hypothetical protein
MADVRRERFGVCSTPVLSGTVITVLAGGKGNGIFVSMNGIFAWVSYNVISGRFEVNDALVSGLTFSASSHSVVSVTWDLAFCCCRIRSTIW